MQQEFAVIICSQSPKLFKFRLFINKYVHVQSDIVHLFSFKGQNFNFHTSTKVTLQFSSTEQLLHFNVQFLDRGNLQREIYLDKKKKKSRICFCYEN